MSLLLSGPMMKLPAAGGGGVTVSLQGTSSQTSNFLTTYTYSGVPIGAADASREIWVFFAGAWSGTPGASSEWGATVDGNTATEILYHFPNSNSVIWGWKYNLTTGTTAVDVVISRSSGSTTMKGGLISVFRSVGSPTLTTQTAYNGSLGGTSPTAYRLDVSQTVTAGSALALIGGAQTALASITYGFNGETWDSTAQGGNDGSGGTAFIASATGGSPQTLTIDYTGAGFTNDGAAVSMEWA